MSETLPSRYVNKPGTADAGRTPQTLRHYAEPRVSGNHDQGKPLRRYVYGSSSSQLRPAVPDSRCA